MKYLIVSDSHGYNDTMIDVIKKVSPLDGLFHCGDLQMSSYELHDIANCPTWCVKGNNDYFEEGLEKSREVVVGRHKIAMIHGHQMGVYAGTDRLVYWAKELGADVVMYGHTHIPDISYVDGVTVINPGSISRPRQEGRRPTYIIMERDNSGVLHFTLKTI